jgi:hypothetical protein
VDEGEAVGEVGDGVGLGVGDADVGPGVGDAEVGPGVGDADVGLGVGADVGLGVGADVGLGVGEADVKLRPGDGLTDAEATATGKNAIVPATTEPAMLTRRMHATQRRLAAADLGGRNLVLEILASTVTVAPAPSFREPVEAD